MTLEANTEIDNVDKLIERFEKIKFERRLYHHVDQIEEQKKGYYILESEKGHTDIDKYPLFKLVSWIIPFMNSIPHMFLLMKYARSSRICILEIGTCHGSSAIALGIGAAMYGGNNPKLITIDMVQPEDEAKGFFELFKEFLPSNSLIVQSDSKTFSFNEPIDLLYVDGGHEYEDVYADCKKYIPLVIRGGTVIFHDYRDRKVYSAVERFFYENKDKIKYERIPDNPMNFDGRFSYNSVGISVVKIIENSIDDR